MEAPVRTINKCPECGTGLPYYIYATDWMFESEPVYPCDGCGQATCGTVHTEWDIERDGEGGYFVNYRSCPSCDEGRAYRETVAFEYARSRGV